ncbi:MAG: hypothetical protein A2X85_17345 [Geobacteraceae bacterium GWF2_54_21]|nr:MAG: hypothetical protein A2X85_17345 [Geobacteraceae bacterium GWF2_54_21]
MTWSIQKILTCLQRIGLKCLAKKQGLSISGKNSELCTRIGHSYQNKPNACLSDLRKKDLKTLINCFSEENEVYLQGVADLSRNERLRILKRILLKDEDPQIYGFFKKPPHDYQIEAIRNGLDALVSQNKPVGIHVGTGGGKTFIGNDIVFNSLKEHGGTFFWISKDWELLKHAMKDLNLRHPTVRVRRFGGKGKGLNIKEFDLNEDFKGVVYTTLHTLHQHKDEYAEILSKASRVVWDESHWAQNSLMGQPILELCKENKIPVLGLTATPLNNDTFNEIYHCSFFELISKGSLARPIVVEPVSTNIDWSPELNRNCELNRNSLRNLGSNKKRNRIAAEHYATNSAKYKQTLVFACDIKHANRLVKAFKLVGVAVAPIHGDIKEKQRDHHLQEFRDGIIHVLVNVEMLTHGTDIPSITTVFLCRPTASEILFAQMIGRGARLQEGKTSFYIVEFTDNVKKHNDVIISAKKYFKGSGNSEPYDWKTGKRPERRKMHNYIPGGHAVWIGDDASIPESVRGLWLKRGQTFGIEFELTHPDMPNIRPTDPEWSKIAIELLNAIRTVTPLVAEEPIYTYTGGDSDYGKDCSLWNIEFDLSVGWEVTSRILSDEGGYLEVDLVCQVLDDAAAKLGLKVNYKTGTHVHLGWDNRPLEDLKRLVRLVRFAEPALATLVAPSRLVSFDGANYDLGEPNEYCQPISAAVTKSQIKSWRSLEDVEESLSTRYVTMNLKSLFKLGTVEVRMHSGTLEAPKILLWLSLSQQMIWGASIDRRIPATEDRDIIEPDGDIVEFARRWLPDAKKPAQAMFLHRLDNRRDEILEVWHKNSDLAGWVEYSEDWQRED